MRTPIRLSALAALPLACAAVALTSCGAADDARQALDPVAQAAATTERAGNAQIAVHGTITAGGQAIAVRGSGVVSGTGDRARMTVRVGRGDKGLRFDQVVDGQVLYVGSDLLRRATPGGKRWMKLDLRKIAAAKGVDLGRFDSGTGDLTRQLRYLRGAGAVRRVGTETVGGVATTRYRARIELARLAEDAGDPATRRSVEQLRRLAGSATIPLEVWIDGDHRVRRQRISYRLGPQSRTCSAEVTIDYLRFGVALDAGPPADEAVDVSKLVTQGSTQGP